MKKLVYPVVLLLVALLLVGPMVPAAVAMEPFAKPAELTEADWRRNNRRRPAPRPRPRPAPRRDSHHGGDNFAGALIGSAIGGLIGSVIANSRDEPDVYYVEPAPAPVYVQPAPPVIVQPAQPVMVCDQYGNCWYEYN